MRGKLPLVAAAIAGSLVAAAPAAATTSEVRDRGTVTLDVAVKKFAVSQGRIVGRGELTARLTDLRGASQATKRPVRFAVAAQSSNCRILTLTLDDLQLDLLGLSVDASTVNLRLHGIQRGTGGGVLGRLFCRLSRSTVRLNGSIRASQARKTVRALNSRMDGRPLRAIGARAQLTSDAEAAQYQGPSCKVLRLVLGPLDLNLLGLVVELYGERRTAPVTLTITAFPGQGALGDVFCSVAGGPRP